MQRVLVVLWALFWGAFAGGAMGLIVGEIVVPPDTFLREVEVMVYGAVGAGLGAAATAILLLARRLSRGSG